MSTITITIADLNALTHALLIAKCGYLCSAIDRKTDWNHTKRGVEALNALYHQLEAARLQPVEG